MMNTSSNERMWSASWIWGGSEKSPRNQWRCFRHSFRPSINSGSAQLHISADSRYVLFVNGQRVGRGPSRSWPTQQSYDTHEVGHLLQPEKDNSIAVLVLHFGISNFYYIRGQGGLIAELTMNDKTLAATNASWKTSVMAGQQANSPRMSIQQGFSEIIDGRQAEEGWEETDFNDGHWPLAHSLAGEEVPWAQLVPRDIPFLTEEKLYPAAIRSLHRVKPAAFTAAIDLRHQMVPESTDHANPMQICGYLATLLRLETKGYVTIGFPGGVRSDWLLVDGVNQLEWTGVQPERYYGLQLAAGDHLLLIDVTSTDHSGPFHLAADSEVPFSFHQPFAEDAAVPFVSIGPFDHNVQMDHLPDRPVLFREHPLYLELRKAKKLEDLLPIQDWIRPVDERLYTEEDVFGANVWQKEDVTLAVPLSLQNAVLPVAEPAVLPGFGHKDCQLVIDLGKELSGFIGFEVDAPEGTVLDFYGVEYMRDDYIQHTYGLENTFRYYCREGRQRYLSPVRRGFRYLILTVRGNTAPVCLHEVYLNQSNYPAPQIGRFACSDPLLNDIWEISRHTTRLCMEDTFVDCPSYEQVFWVGDSRNEALVNYSVFGATDIVKRCLSLVPGSSPMTPLYVNQVPSAWSSVIPNWTFFWVIACQEYTEHTGDLAFARMIWPAVRHTLSHYMKHVDNSFLLNIKGWNLLDWAPIEQPNEGIVTHQNCFMVRTLRLAVQLAEMAGLAQEAKDSGFALLAEQMAEAINTRLWNPDKEAYLDCIYTDGQPSKRYSMQTQVVAYLCDIPGIKERAIIEHYLERPPLEFVQIGSPFMSFFYYEALARMGNYSLILEDIRKHYGMMVEYDATTCWEMYPDFTENRANPHMLTRSHCHAWSAAPGYFLGTVVLGVKRMDTGWSNVEIAPQPCGLNWASGTVPLPEGGQIQVSWKIEKSRMSLRVESPKNVILHVRWPEGIEGTLTHIAVAPLSGTN